MMLISVGILRFFILLPIKEMGYLNISRMWYGNLKLLKNDFSAIEMVKWIKTKGKVDLYLIHPISQLEFVEEIEFEEEQIVL